MFSVSLFVKAKCDPAALKCGVADGGSLLPKLVYCHVAGGRHFLEGAIPNHPNLMLFNIVSFNSVCSLPEVTCRFSFSISAHASTRFFLSRGHMCAVYSCGSGALETVGKRFELHHLLVVPLMCAWQKPDSSWRADASQRAQWMTVSRACSQDHSARSRREQTKSGVPEFGVDLFHSARLDTARFYRHLCFLLLRAAM